MKSKTLLTFFVKPFYEDNYDDEAEARMEIEENHDDDERGNELLNDTSKFRILIKI